MAVPAEIRNVERPDNTVVVKCKSCYEVRTKIPFNERTNKNTKYGDVVGYIESGRFVPKQDKPQIDTPYMVSAGAILLLLSVALPILSALTNFFPLNVAQQIFILACLKVAHPGLTISNANFAYKNSLFAICYPSVALTSNSITKLLNDLGLNEKSRLAYGQSKLQEITNKYHILYIDGSHKQLNSKSNPLSKKPYKEKYQGYDVINVITLYSLFLTDVVCSSVYPGSFSDTSVYRTFLLDNGIIKGILFGDAAFLASIVAQLKSELAQLEELHYIGIMRSNDTRIEELKKLNLNKAFESPIGYVTWTVEQDQETGKYYYVFKNEKINARQKNAYIRKRLNDCNDIYADVKFDDESFGTIYVETDLPFDAKQLYEIILDRWVIEVVFHKEKSDLCFDKTRVHGVMATLGLQFVNDVATSIYLKVCQKIENIKGKTSFIDYVKSFNDIWMKINDNVRTHAQNNPGWLLNEGMPSSDSDTFVYTNKNRKKQLELLGLVKNNTQDKTNQIKPMDQGSDPLANMFNLLIENFSHSLSTFSQYIENKISSLCQHEENNNDYTQLIQEIYGSLYKLKDALTDIKEKVDVLSTLHNEEVDYNQVDTSVAKVRKTRCDKGVKRGPYKKQTGSNQPCDTKEQEQNASQALIAPVATPT